MADSCTAICGERDKDVRDTADHGICTELMWDYQSLKEQCRDLTESKVAMQSTIASLQQQAHDSTSIIEELTSQLEKVEPAQTIGEEKMSYGTAISQGLLAQMAHMEQHLVLIRQQNRALRAELAGANYSAT